MRFAHNYEIKYKDMHEYFENCIVETEAEIKGKRTIQDNHSRASLARYTKRLNTAMVAKSRR